MSPAALHFSNHVQTSRMYVRPYEEKNFEAHLAYIMDPKLQRGLGLHDVKDRATAKSTFDWLRRNRVFLALKERGQGWSSGISLYPPYARVCSSSEFSDKKVPSLSLARAAGKRRKGLTEEALGALIGELFEREATDYFDYEFEQTNVASNEL